MLCLAKGAVSLPDSGDESGVVGGLPGTAVGAMVMAAAVEVTNEKRRKLDLKNERRRRTKAKETSMEKKLDWQKRKHA